MYLIFKFFVHVFFVISIVFVSKWRMEFVVIVVLLVIIQAVSRCFGNVLIV